MYTKKSLKKLISLFDEKIAFYMGLTDKELQDCKLCISRGNRKIGKVMNVSLPPVITCANCSGCMKLCYDIKACLQYPGTVINARVKNWIIYKRNSEKFFDDIRKALKYRRTNKFFRWHVAGDIPDMAYFQSMIDIAREFPDFVFWTYTKNYNLINKYCDEFGKDSIPVNLSIMFSEWRGMSMKNPYNFPVFSVVFNDDTEKPDPKTNHYCPGNCDICLKAGKGCPFGEDTYCHEH